MTKEDRMAARGFIADWFGFSFGRIRIEATQRDEMGNVIAVFFRVQCAARLRYLARRLTAEAEWELTILP